MSTILSIRHKRLNNSCKVTYPQRKIQTKSGIHPTLLQNIPNIFTKYLIFGNPIDKKCRPNNPCSWMLIQTVKKTNYPPPAAAKVSEDPPHYEHSEIPQDRELHQGNSLSSEPQAPNQHRPRKKICERKQIQFYYFWLL